MKKKKSESIDLLYILEDDNKKEKKEKKEKKYKKKKLKKKAKEKKQSNSTNQNGVFDFDDEIVIGITKKENETKKVDKKTSKKKKNNKQKKDKTKEQNKKQVKEEIKTKVKQEEQKQKKKKNKSFKIAKYLFLFILVAGGIIAFMLSPVFDIKTITVKGNNKLTADEIISLSEIRTDVNTFKIRTGQVERKIKQNAYIEDVNISRSLPSEIVIEVTERTATYMLEFVNSVVYINNQGYMLEITDQKIPVPLITGINTPTEEFKEGNRLDKEDLQKMETVLKIMDTLESYGLSSLVTKINIADKKNYILIFEGEGKTVYLGNASNINTRIMYLKEIIEREKGINSEVFINGDINKDDVYTREKV